MRHIALQMSERAIVRTCLSIDQSSSQALCPRVPTVTIRKTCPCNINPRVQVGKDQEKAQSEKDSYSKNRDGKKLT